MSDRSVAFYRGENWMKRNKQKTQYRWRKAAVGLLTLLLSLGMACSAFAETAAGTGVPQENGAAGIQAAGAGTQSAAAQIDNTPRKMEQCTVKLDRYLSICSGQAQTPQVLAVEYTYTREIAKPEPEQPQAGTILPETDSLQSEADKVKQAAGDAVDKAKERAAGQHLAERKGGESAAAGGDQDAAAGPVTAAPDEDMPESREDDADDAADAEPGTSKLETVTETLAPEEYSVSYLDADGNEIKACTEVGEYTVVVTGKGRYTGTATAAYTILGKPQKMTTAKMKHRITRSAKPLQLSVRADGDGTGITWESRNKGVATVSESGLVTPQALGRVYIYAQTAGDRISQSAKLRFTIEICPDRTTRLSVRRSSDEAAEVSWNPVSGADRYELRYASEADFARKQYQTLTVNKNTLFTELTSLQKGQAYLIQLRAISEHKDGRGSKYSLYGGWSSTQRITAARRSIQASDHLTNVLKVRAHFLR